MRLIVISDTHGLHNRIEGLFGHAGTFENGATRFVNAAYLNERYKPLDPAGKIRIVDL